MIVLGCSRHNPSIPACSDKRVAEASARSTSPHGALSTTRKFGQFTKIHNRKRCRSSLTFLLRLAPLSPTRGAKSGINAIQNYHARGRWVVFLQHALPLRNRWRPYDCYDPINHTSAEAMAFIRLSAPKIEPVTKSRLATSILPAE